MCYTLCLHYILHCQSKVNISEKKQTRLKTHNMIKETSDHSADSVSFLTQPKAQARGYYPASEPVAGFSCRVLKVMSYFGTGFIFVCLGCVYFIHAHGMENERGNENNWLSKTEDPAVTRFRQYLRINSAPPNPDYESCINWLKIQANRTGLDFNIVRFQAPDLFAVWLTWHGSNPSLQSILLNSHMDVVTANSSNWLHDPFEAFKEANGDIYARGSQDMKSTTIERLEAINILKKSGFVPLRTVHLAVVPDEEAGGLHGMRPFVNSKEFKALNIGFDLDEGSASGSDVMGISFGQKAAWQIKFTATGMSAHGSSLLNGTAGEKIRVIIDKMMDFRNVQKEILQATPGFTTSDVTTVNLMRLDGGVANNVLPERLSVVFDIRIRVKKGFSFTDMQNIIDETVKEAGPGVSYEFFQKSLDSAETAMDETNPWWMNLKATLDKMNWKYHPSFLGATSDARYLRGVGIPALGFNPGFYVTGRVHQDNEFLNEKSLLRAIDRYVVILRNLTHLSSEHP